MLPYKFRIETTTMCPYSCDYCIQIDRKNTVPLAKPNDNKFTFCINYINNTNLPWYCVSLIGGEPTMCDIEGIFNRFIEECPGKHISFELITNLYKSPDYYKKLTEKFEVSFAVAFHETQITLEKFVERVVAVKDNLFIITFVCTKDNIDYAQTVYDTLSKYGRIRFVKVIGKEDGHYRYPIAQDAHFEEVFNKLQKLPKVMPIISKVDRGCKDHICSGTMYQTAIRFDGSIRCSPSCNVSLGNVYDNPMPLFVDRMLMPCTAEVCRKCGSVHILSGMEKDKCFTNSGVDRYVEG